jgi:aspartyl-tRNA(Asn)/glutamyl-tRNA(Gln) amidotransferase subunit B
MKSGMIGLEIHVYLQTKEKLFCRCKAVRKKGTKPNSFVCPICTGQPGAKPMLPNGAAVEKAVQVALMLGCEVNKEMPWMRKHYTWPDLPKGFQATLSGPKAFPVGEKGNFYGIKIKEIHLEEDPAAWDPETGKVDYNRSGFPLIEIVTEPDFSTGEEVKAWMERLLHNLEYLKAVEKESGLKADVNVNLPGKTERVEVKNVNSKENIFAAIEYELERQAKEGSVLETRRFDADSGKTVRMRGKEDAIDYRFISDPDLEPVFLDDKFISRMGKLIPEGPEEKLSKLVKKFKIGKTDAKVLARHLEVVEFFEEVAKKVEGKFALHWITTELLGMLNYHKTSLNGVEVNVEHFVELLLALKAGKISEAQGKKIVQEFYPKSYSLKERGVAGKISDSEKLADYCKEVIFEFPDVVEKYRAGDKKVLNFLVGQVMKKSGGRADAGVVRQVFEKLI